jgi:CYTH domain-containing protein
MNKTAVTEYRRLFLIEKLPEPLEPKSAHIQIFDNYIEGTRMRLRLVRDPYSKNWTRILQQISVEESIHGGVRIAEIYLDDAEYSNFEQFEGREIRKNRYFHEIDGESFAFDVYLGNLWGLNTAQISSDILSRAEAVEPPSFAVFEITNDPFFLGANLVDRHFDDVVECVQALGKTVPPALIMSKD